MSVPTASLFLTVGGAPLERYLLVRRSLLKKPGDVSTRQKYPFVLQPPVNGKIKDGVDANPLACILREAEHEAGAAFAAFLRDQDPASFMPLPYIEGSEHVHCYHLTLHHDEIDLFIAGREFCETLFLNAAQVGAIEAIDKEAHKECGVPRDSHMMFPDHRLVLRGLVMFLQA